VHGGNVGLDGQSFLLREIRVVFAEVNGIYGHRRIHAELLAQGMNCGRHRIV